MPQAPPWGRSSHVSAEEERTCAIICLNKGNFCPQNSVIIVDDLSIRGSMFFRKNECQKVRQTLSGYIDCRLNPKEQDKVESHLKGCEACRLELDSLRTTVDLLHRVPMVAPRRSFAIAEPRRRPAFGRLNVLRAATAVTGLLLVVVFLGGLLFPIEPGFERDGVPTPAPPEAQYLTQEDGVTPQPSPGLSEAITAVILVSPLLWQIEIALLGFVILLGGMTAFVSWQRRKGGGKGKEAG